MLLKVSKERDTQGQRESWGGEGGRREAGALAPAWCHIQSSREAQEILSRPSQTIKDPDSGLQSVLHLLEGRTCVISS